MTPCDDTANSTGRCSGANKDCCAGDIGVETLAQTFLGAIATSSSVLSLSASLTASIPMSPSSFSPLSTGLANQSQQSTTLSGGAIARISIGVVAGLAFIGAAWFLIARRCRSAGSSAPDCVEEAHDPIATPKMQYACEADGASQQVSEVSAANAKDHDGRAWAYEIQ